jgi:hypothetical protein
LLFSIQNKKNAIFALMQKIITYLLLVFCFGFSSSKLFSQQWDSLHYGLDIHYGFIMNHHQEMAHLSAVHLTAFSLVLEEECDGDKDWHQLYRRPKRGIEFWYSNLGNNYYLGYSLALIPYMHFPLIRTKNYASFFQLGCGLAYVSKPYDRVENPKNNTIGSYLNAAIRLSYSQHIPLSSHWQLIQGINITHFSNGSFTLPNYGVNNLSLSLGLRYIPYNYEKYSPNKEKEKKEIVNQKKWDIYSLVGVKEKYPVAGPKYISYALSFDRVHQRSLKFDYYYGIDIMYDESKKASLIENEMELKKKFAYAQLGAHLGAAWKMGRFSLHTQLGLYLYSPDPALGRIYDRLMLRYEFSEHWMWNIALKTHYARADVFETGIGFRL